MKGQIEQQFDELIFLNKELQIVAPFKVEIVKNIRDILKEYDSMMISTKVSMSLLNTLMSDLMRITRKTGYWEYYCACKEVDITWNNFCSKENIYLKYPKLKDYCQKTINLFIGNVTIILKRINEDYHEICQLLDTIDLIKITSLNIGAGDSHFNGQRVAILEFNNKYKLVYKPRRSSGELLFNDFLKYINQNLSFNHPTYAVITKSDYSYTQFVNHSYCSSEEELENYFSHFGSLMAILYSLGSVDFHYENVIATIRGPVLIDLESVFSPVMYQKIEDNNKENVLSTAMLPQKIWGVDGKEKDISPLSDGKRFLEEEKIVVADNGEAVLKNVKKEVPDLSSCFKLGDSIRVIDFIENILKGFEKTYRYIWELGYKKFITKTPLRNISNAEIRTILRPTFFYSKILYSSYSPRWFGEDDRKVYFKSILHKIEELKRIYPFEIDSLLNGDIPFFQTNANSMNIYSGKELVEKEFFTKSSLGNIEYRVNDKMSDKDLLRQKWFIKNSLELASGLNEKTLEDYSIKYWQYNDIVCQLVTDLQMLGVEGLHKATWVTVTKDRGVPVFSHLDDQRLSYLYLVLLIAKGEGRRVDDLLIKNTKNKLGDFSLKVESYLSQEVSRTKSINDIDKLLMSAESSEYLNYSPKGSLYHWDQVLHLLNKSQKNEILKSFQRKKLLMNDMKNVEIPDFENGLGGILYFMLRLKNSALPTWNEIKEAI